MNYRDKILDEIKEERESQIMKHHFSTDKDDQCIFNELASAAATYALNHEHFWPWKDHPYRGAKDSERHRLITAGALILAEIERLDRNNI